MVYIKDSSDFEYDDSDYDFEEPDYDSIVQDEIEQTQYFLQLPAACVKKLKSFVRSKAFKLDKYKAIVGKIEEIDETMFLEKLFEAIFLDEDNADL